MAKGQQRDPAREAKWRAVLARYRGSGLSVRGFCERERLPESAFYAWRRTIQQREAQGPAFVPLVVQAQMLHQGQGPITIELRGGRLMRLPISLPPAQLAAIVHAIEEAA